MRAMILAAGLGTRLRPLSELCPKPAMPVRGIPLVAFGLHWLAAQGVRQVVVNVHHLPERVREGVERYGPGSLEVRFSEEPRLLDTGGGIRRAASFLRESDPCVVVAADMLLDVSLAPIVAEHQAGRSGVTLVLRDDPRGGQFGTIGLDAGGRVRRIGGRLDLGGEERAGLYLSLALLSPGAFDWMPEAEVFGILDAWLGRRLQEGGDDVRGTILERESCIWEPVGTPEEYLQANLTPPRLGYFDPDEPARRAGVRFEPGRVIGAGAEIGANVDLQRAVVWEGERVPAGLRARGGVFAGGRFHPCEEPRSRS